MVANTFITERMTDMIDIKKDEKSDNFIITQTTRIQGDDFHKQMTLTKEEMTYVYAW